MGPDKAGVSPESVEDSTAAAQHRNPRAAGVFVFGGTAQAGRPGTGAIREATLTEAQVVPGAGDTQGMSESRLIFYPNKHKLCYTIQVSGIARATSAHLREAPAGQSARRSSG